MEHLGWAVMSDDAGQMHVVPAINTSVAVGHVLTAECWCRPVRDGGPLDEPVWSHRQADWPGAHLGPAWLT
jgi:hypothetical protein